MAIGRVSRCHVVTVSTVLTVGFFLKFILHAIIGTHENPLTLMPGGGRAVSPWMRSAMVVICGRIMH
jgi:hypothetical protein